MDKIALAISVPIKENISNGLRPVLSISVEFNEHTINCSIKYIMDIVEGDNLVFEKVDNSFKVLSTSTPLLNLC